MPRSKIYKHGGRAAKLFSIPEVVPLFLTVFNILDIIFGAKHEASVGENQVKTKCG